jgi:CheY-like chemotaxis protein
MDRGITSDKESLRQQARQVRRLTEELTTAEDQERKRVAQLLHDDVQQLLIAAKFSVEGLSTSVQRSRNPELAKGVQKALRLLDQAIHSVRSLSSGLSPAFLDEEGLQKALEWLGQDLQVGHGLRVRFAVSHSVRITNRSLRRFLFQATQEMLLNVVKHAGEQEAVVELEMRERDLVLRVTDRGQGFDPSEFISDAGPDRAYGLANIRERCSLLGGSMQIQSEAGHGTQISLSFPITQVQEELGFYEVKPLVPSQGRPIRVLIVDDHEILREGLTSALSTEPGIEVVGEASTGELALKLVPELKPDLVLMDVQMSGIGGVEATRRIRRDPKGPEVIGLTVALDEYTEGEMRKAGARTVLPKSASVTGVVAAIRSSGVPNSQEYAVSSETVKEGS